jgi:hypothetical protein
MTDFWRVLVTASREPDSVTGHRALVHQKLDERLMVYGRITVVHGDCPTGGDLYAREWAELQILMGMRQGEAWVRHEAYPALWGEFDKAAGPIRNKYMVMLEADECIGFPMPSSRGTISCMDLAAAAGIPIINYGAQI